LKKKLRIIIISLKGGENKYIPEEVLLAEIEEMREKQVIMASSPP
jgi:hypothetical protein